MTRRIWLSLLMAMVLLPTIGHATEHDRTVEQFMLPASNTSGFRVHTARATLSHMNVTIPRGNIWAVGGYKTPVVFTHVVTASLAGLNIGVAQSGVSFQRLGYEGSILGVALASSQAITVGRVDAEATIQRQGVVTGTALVASIRGDNLGPPQFASVTQARGLDVFLADHEIGCRITTTSNVVPAGAQLVCTVVVEF